MLAARQQEIQAIERKVDFVSIIESAEPSVILLRKENYDSLYNFVVMCTANYLELCHPALLHIAPTIAADLIDSRPNWKAADFINLFKFFRQTPTDTNLNMTYERLINRVTEYEFKRIEAQEQYHAKHKGQLSEENKSLDKLTPKLLERFTSKSDEDLVKRDGGMGKEFDNVQAERERTGKNVIYKQVTPDENYFESKK